MQDKFNVATHDRLSAEQQRAIITMVEARDEQSSIRPLLAALAQARAV